MYVCMYIMTCFHPLHLFDYYLFVLCVSVVGCLPVKWQHCLCIHAAFSPTKQLFYSQLNCVS